MQTLLNTMLHESPTLTMARLNAKENDNITDHLRNAGFSCIGFGSNEHWRNKEIIICINENQAQWFENGKCTKLSIAQLYFKLINFKINENENSTTNAYLP